MIEVKKLSENAILPTLGTDGAGGFDLSALDRVELAPKQSMLVDTGIALAIPQGWVGIISPRSGMATKGIRVGARVIDSDYRGEIKIHLINDGLEVFEIRAGDRVCQIVVVPCMQKIRLVHNLPTTDRGVSGFGSTGR